MYRSPLHSTLVKQVTILQILYYTPTHWAQHTSIFVVVTIFMSNKLCLNHEYTFCVDWFSDHRSMLWHLHQIQTWLHNSDQASHTYVSCVSYTDTQVCLAWLYMAWTQWRDGVWTGVVLYHSPMLSELAHSGIQSIHSVHRLFGEEWCYMMLHAWPVMCSWPQTWSPSCQHPDWATRMQVSGPWYIQHAKFV